MYDTDKAGSLYYIILLFWAVVAYRGSEINESHVLDTDLKL